MRCIKQRELDYDILDIRLRILNKPIAAADRCWDERLITMLRKKGFQVRVKDFRPSAVLPVLYKLYSRVLLSPQLAGRKHHQAHKVVFILHKLVEKTLDRDDQLFVLDGDLREAYDYPVIQTWQRPWRPAPSPAAPVPGLLIACPPLL